MSQFKGISYDALAKAVKTLNDRILAADHVKQIISFLPSKQEVIMR